MGECWVVEGHVHVLCLKIKFRIVAKRVDEEEEDSQTASTLGEELELEPVGEPA